ncbi:hypothetical protein M9458_051206, partial [Cirrhinus mrigala]
AVRGQNRRSVALRKTTVKNRRLGAKKALRVTEEDHRRLGAKKALRVTEEDYGEEQAVRGQKGAS